MVSIHGFGVVISGDSGSGKTETCFELEKLGFEFLADDAVEFFTDGATIFGTATVDNKEIAYRQSTGFVRLSRCPDPVPIKFEFKLDESVPICVFQLCQNDIQRIDLQGVDSKRYASEIERAVTRLL